MGAVILGALGGQADRARVLIDLAPHQAADLLAPAAGQNQQSNDLAEVRVHVAGIPDSAEFVRAQGSITLGSLRLTLGVVARVCVDVGKALQHQSGEGRLKLRPCAACGDVAARLPDLMQPPGDGLPRDSVDVDLVQRAEILSASRYSRVILSEFSR